VVNITGNGAILNGGRLAHLFDITRTAEDREAALTILNLTIKNGFATEGGAINAEAQTTLRLYDTTFSTNIATNGGAIYTKGVLFCLRCVFDNNAAYDEAAERVRPQRGGALFCAKCNAEISDSTLSNNKAVQGGAIYIEGPGPEDPEDLVSGLKMRNSKFSDNTVSRAEDTGKGAAVYAIRSTVTFITCEFTRNACGPIPCDATGEMSALLFYQCELLDSAAGSPTAANGQFYCLVGYSLLSNQSKCEECAPGFYNNLGMVDLADETLDKATPREACGNCVTCPAGRYGNECE
jgi:predicted outer membrane repeat protein